MHFLPYDIEHHAGYPWQFVQGRTCFLRLRCNEPVKEIKIRFGDPFWFPGQGEKLPVLEEQPVLCTQCFLEDTFYSIAIPMQTHKLRYHFLIQLQDGTRACLSEMGLTDEVSERQLRPFTVPYVFELEHYAAPDWARDLIWYQIFPDRFSREKEKAGFVPSRDNFYGGTLKGISAHIPYLSALGVQGLYLNPIFSATSNHRYDTVDYASIDRRLGSREDLRELSDTLHRNGMKLMLDGVFNHCGWDHPFWQDVLQKGMGSPYCDWFYIHDMEALRGASRESFPPRRLREECPFESFAFAANMPKWNTENDRVIDYLTGCAEAWTREFQIDAWRLDVPDEVSMKFLREFRRRIRQSASDVYIIGEIWQDPALWLSSAVFDGVMDYPLYYAVRDFAMTGTDDLETFSRRIYRWYITAPETVHRYQWAFCSNHDIPRLLTECGGDMERVKEACFLTAVLGGNMGIYYGDEIGMLGGEDPDNRRAMDWEHPDREIFRFYSALNQLKRSKLYGCKIMRISLNAAVTITLKTPAGTRLLAIITEPGKRAALPALSGWTPVFGEAVQTDHTEIKSFALLEETAAEL